MTDENNDPFPTYAAFWPFYLSQHTKRATRRWHILGTFLALFSVVLAVAFFKPGFLLMAPIIGYGVAWVAHTHIEKNRPATFNYPLWSLRGDFHMLWLWLTGRLESELIKHQIST